MATYVTSDLHGMNPETCLKLLKQADFGAEDWLYVLGDVIDRGEHGIRLLTLLMNYIPLKAATLREWEDGHSDDERERGPLTDGRFVLLTGALLHGALRYFETHAFVLMNGEKKPLSVLKHPACKSVPERSWALPPLRAMVRAS